MKKRKTIWRLFVLAQALLLLTVTLAVSAQHSPRIASILQRVMPGTTFSYTLDMASPVGTDAPSTLDNKIRESRYGFQERLNVDHIFGLTGTQLSDTDTGYHRDIHFYSTTSTDPILGVTAVSGTDELRYTDSDGTAVTLTSGGTLNIGSNDIVGTVTNNAWFTAVDNAGTGTVNLIRASTSDVAELPDGTVMTTSAAPTTDAMVANKKYVDDDNSSTDGYTPATYAGQQSVTFPNGLVMKTGNVAAGAVAFSAGFPTAIVSVVATSNVDNTAPKITDPATGGFTLAGPANAYYIAWGY